MDKLRSKDDVTQAEKDLAIKEILERALESSAGAEALVCVLLHRLPSSVAQSHTSDERAEALHATSMGAGTTPLLGVACITVLEGLLRRDDVPPRVRDRLANAIGDLREIFQHISSETVTEN